MADKVFITLLKRLATQKKLIDEKELNEEILTLFPDKTFLAKQKKAKNYFKKLVFYQMGVINKTNLEEVLKLLDTIYKKIYTESSTLDSAFSQDIRKPIVLKYGRNSEEHKMAKKLAKLSYKVKGELINHRKTRLKEEHLEIHRFDPLKIQTIIKDSMVSDDGTIKAVGLSLASGCRPIELFEKANFFESEKVKGWIFQDWLAKKRENGDITVDKPIIGMTPEEFINQVGDMRHDLGARFKKLSTRNNELTKAASTTMNQVTKMLFDFEDGITFYSCRKIYGQLSYELFGKNSIYGKDPSIQSWLADVLGHADGDIITATHYNNFKLEDREVKYVDITALQAEVNDLKNRLDNNGVPKIESVKIDPKNAKMIARFEIIKNAYENESKDNKKINQTQMEKLLAGQVPRAVIRLWYQQNVI